MTGEHVFMLDEQTNERTNEQTNEQTRLTRRKDPQIPQKYPPISKFKCSFWLHLRYKDQSLCLLIRLDDPGALDYGHGLPVPIVFVSHHLLLP